MRNRSRAVVVTILALASAVAVAQTIQEYPVPQGPHPYDLPRQDIVWLSDFDANVALRPEDRAAQCVQK